ncbi:DUF389 domain-containing protein [Gilvibacter sediminis]|uniref:DUF389 domain-containing protein n=1 Tax=Gilvibacter sediminis TaxID=379071 RepID=UPI002350BB36|nr:DUF389 domain-containing protein [Gilvibacter sediminis]MDC7997578.1 DUF389 domain-containing protein [Gilvibacter sediminis]
MEQQSQQPDDAKTQEQKEHIRKEAKGLFKSVRQFVVDIFDFRGDTDRETTVNAVKADIPFKGATAWILICSIFVASVGLNANSTAVVIGAMLISPLMGPILGIGLSIAINDIDTLRKSLINFGVMVVLSVLTAFLFFWLFPLREETSELLGRTRPDFRDVLIAFFGGLALIIARTKKGTIASVIFGVAIATALMPPLCTVGYGLAEFIKENPNGLSFALGALYLFSINTIFIALATFIVVKVLGFPMIRYANSKRRKRIARFASVAALIVMLPAGYTFYNVIKESRFNEAAKNFINNELNSLANANYIKRNATFDYNNGQGGSIVITTFGQDNIPESTEAVLRGRLQAYKPLVDAKFEVNQSQFQNGFEDELRYMEQLRTRDSLDLLSQSQKIQYYEQELLKLRMLERDLIPFQDICDEARINYDALASIQYAKTFVNDFKKIDTLNVFAIRWNDSLPLDQRPAYTKRLTNWLKFKLKADTLVVQELQ